MTRSAGTPPRDRFAVAPGTPPRARPAPVRPRLAERRQRPAPRGAALGLGRRRPPLAVRPRPRAPAPRRAADRGRPRRRPRARDLHRPARQHARPAAAVGLRARRGRLRRARQAPRPLRPRRADAARLDARRGPRALPARRRCSPSSCGSRARPCSAAGSAATRCSASGAARSSALLAFRGVARAVARRLSPAERCLVVGDPVAREHARSKIEAAAHGVDATVAAATSIDELTDDDLASEALARLVERHDVHRVVIAPGATRPGRGPRPRPGRARRSGCSVSLLPRMFEVVGSSVEFDDVEGVTLLGVRRFGLTRSSRVLKRAFDLVGASVGLVLLAPLLAVIAVAIRLDSPRPGVLPPAARRARRLRLRDGQVPHDGRRRRPPQGGAARPQRGRGPVQDRRRPADHARRALPAPHLARRAAAAVQRAARRDEPRRPAAARARRGRPPGRGLAPPPAGPHAGHDRPLAGARLARASRCARWSSSTTSTSPTGRCGAT